MGTKKHKMGRRKIEMEYIPDDRVRKVTFCKRKGGLFKKADDLAKLCGVEIAVLIVGENKINHHVSEGSSLDHVVRNFQTLQAGQAVSEADELSKLIKRGEEQRRQIEALTRELAEKNKMMTAGLLPTLPIQSNPMMSVPSMEPHMMMPQMGLLPQAGVPQAGVPQAGGYIQGLPAGIEPASMAQPVAKR